MISIVSPGNFKKKTTEEQGHVLGAQGGLKEAKSQLTSSYMWSTGTWKMSTPDTPLLMTHNIAWESTSDKTYYTTLLVENSFLKAQSCSILLESPGLSSNNNVHFQNTDVIT